MAGVSRPFPITVVSLLTGLGALGGIVFGGLAIAAGAVAAGGVTLVLALFSFVCAYGLWSLAGWAWMLAMLAQILNIIGVFVPLALGGSIDWVQGGVKIVIAVLILLYLNSGGVKKAFGR